MITNTQWLTETIEFARNQKRKMQVGVFFKEDNVSCFGVVVQQQDNGYVVLEVQGNTPSTISTKTTRRITTADITDVIVKLV